MSIKRKSVALLVFLASVFPLLLPFASVSAAVPADTGVMLPSERIVFDNQASELEVVEPSVVENMPFRSEEAEYSAALRRRQSELGIISLDDSMTLVETQGNEYSSYSLWENIPIRARLRLLTTFRTIALSISSSSAKKVTVSASAISNSTTTSMIGLSSLSIQRYYMGRWITVYTWRNDYDYGTQRFYFSGSRTGLMSGSYYRATATFKLRVGMNSATLTRTTTNIRCK